MKKLWLILFLTPVVFAGAELNIKSVDYTNLYSNSASHIIFTLENNGDETAFLKNSTITDFKQYFIYYSPSSISPGTQAEIIFQISTICEPKEQVYNFFANFTYEDSTQTLTENSTLLTITTSSPLSVEILEPEDINSLMGIRIDQTRRLLYTVSNKGLEELQFKITVISAESIYSKIKTTKKEFSSNMIGSETFRLQPNEYYILSHSLIPVISGGAGAYTVYIEDERCQYNKEILRINYEIFSSTRSSPVNIIVADENNQFIITLGIITTILLFCLFR